MAEKIKLFEADIDVDGILRKSKELADETARLGLEQKKLKATVGDTSEAFLVNDARLKKVRSELRLNQKQVSNLSETNGKLLTVGQKLNLSLAKEVSTVSNAAKNNAELKKIRNQVNVKTDEGQKLISKINERLDKNTELIKANVSGLEQQKINIGDYKQQIKDAYGELDIMNGGLLGFIGRAKEAGGVGKLLKSSFASAASGLKGLTKATVSFLFTPLGVFLAVIVGSLALVKSAMNRSETATNKIKLAFSSFSGILNKLLNALQPIGEFLIDGLAAGFEIAEKAIYKGIDAIASGLELLGFEDQAQSLRKFNSEVQESAKQANALAKAEAQLKISQREARKIQLEYQKDAEKLRQIRDNENLSIRERIQANENLGKVLEQQLNAELEIAKQALLVANLRVEAEGKTSEALDAQEDALANISDIQERITGQESEQLTNRVSLQKEYADKQKAIADELIKSQQEQLDLFIAQQGLRSKTLQEQLELQKQVSEKSIEILEAELRNRNITQTKFDAEVLKIKNDLLQKNNELVVSLAQSELNIYLENTQSKIDADLFFSAESLRIEQERIDEVSKKQKDFAKLQLDKGVTNQTEYNAAINAIDEENRLKNIEAENLRNEAIKEKELIDQENKRIIDEEAFQNDLALRYERLEIQKNQEIENAIKTNADISLIDKKYEAFKNNLDKEISDFKVSQNQNTLNAVASLLGEESNLGKLAAVAAIVNDTATQASKAFSQAAVFASNPLTAPLAVNAKIQGGLIIAKGAAQSAKLIAPKFEKGGAFKIGGNRHSNGGTQFYGDDGTRFEAERDETMFILNRQASSTIAPLLSKINQQHGGVSFSNSSSYLEAGGQVLRGAKVAGTDYTKMSKAIEQAVMKGSAMGTEAGALKGSMEGTSQGAYSGIRDREDFLAIQSGANF